jgi:hypothetical protein
LPKNINKRQREAIRGYVNKGYSANQIQVELRNQRMGIRRKVLLAEVRRVKGQKLKAETVKYIPKKYAKVRWRARAKAPSRKRLRPIVFEERQVTLIGRHDGKRIIKKQHGSGRELYRFVLDEMTGDYWDERPHVIS